MTEVIVSSLAVYMGFEPTFDRMAGLFDDADGTFDSPWVPEAVVVEPSGVLTITSAIQLEVDFGNLWAGGFARPERTIQLDIQEGLMSSCLVTSSAELVAETSLALTSALSPPILTREFVAELGMDLTATPQVVVYSAVLLDLLASTSIDGPRRDGLSAELTATARISSLLRTQFVRRELVWFEEEAGASPVLYKDVPNE